MRDAIDLGVAVLGTLLWGGCDPSRYDAAGTDEVTFTATAGEMYTILVDGARDHASTFTLAVECGP